MILLLSAAWASPDRLAAVLEAGTGAADLVLDGDRAALTIEGSLVLLDLETWGSTTVSACSGAAGLTSAGGLFYVGCADGSVTSVDADLVLTDGAYTFGGAVLGLASDGTSLFAVTETDGVQSVEAVDLATGAAVSGFPASLVFDGYEDLAIFGTSLLVLQGSDDVTRVETGSGYTSLAIEPYGGSFLQAWPDGTTGVLLADSSGGGVARFDGYDNGFTPLLTLLGDEVSAVAADTDTLYVAVDGHLLSYSYTAGSFAGDSLGDLAGVGAVSDLLPTDGYLLAVDDVDVLVLTDRPWVDIVSQSTERAVRGDTVVVGFTSDMDGSWVASLDGATLDSGDVVAGEETEARFDVGDDFPEGTNRVRLEVTHNGLVGHDAVDLDVDNPPGAVSLGAIGVGDGQLTVSFTGLDDADLASYTVYLSETPFTAGDYPTGGPSWTGEATVDAPRLVAATPGADVRVSFYPLTNGTAYYVAVRATDSGGLEGPMSDVLSGTPLATYSASQLSGDPGGFSCATGGARPLGLLALGIGALLAGRRRSAGLVVLAGLGLSLPARADEDEPKPHMNVVLKGGPVTLADPHVRDIFGKVNKSFGVEYGATTRLVELDAGIGFYQELGFLPTETGEASVEHDMLTLVPLTLSGTLRLDFFHEQVLVPFGRIGGDYVMWRENWYVYEGSTEESARKGAKLGWHWAAGGMILLDGLDEKASSRLEATAGIDDTYLVVEYRRTQLPKGENVLLLSAEQLNFGVKFDF